MTGTELLAACIVLALFVAFAAALAEHMEEPPPGGRR